MIDELLKGRHADYLDFIRLKMVEDQVARRGVKDERVLEALRKVKRHLFVPDGLKSVAYDDHPLPLDFGQTVSQPYIVGLMTELAAVKPGDKVLEIGAGSGYQTAVLAELGARVYAVEYFPQLCAAAGERLRGLGYAGVQLRAGDGAAGWPEEAPFDAIIAACAPEQVPPAYAAQLKEGGRLVLPLGPEGAQELMVCTFSGGRLEGRPVCAVRFVPMLEGKR